MKKLIKIFSLLLALAICTSTAVIVNAEENYLDPFNNDMFSVVKEIVLPEDYYNNIKDTMMAYNSVANEDYSMVKIFQFGFNNEGEYIQTDITDFMPKDEYYKKISELYEYRYNDGLILNETIDEEWGGFLIYSYTDIYNNILFEGIQEQGADFGYNIGILRDSYSPMDMETGTHRGGHTTFTNIMSDKKTYSFHADFTDFNDDGYALMQDDDKCYLVKLKEGVIPTVFYNNQKIKFDQIPVIENGRTLVPLRAIFEAIGAEVSWDAETSTVGAKKGDVSIQLTIGNNTAYKNGEAINLDVAAQIVGGRTLVPVRFIADCFGVSVDWEPTMKQVILNAQ